MNEFDLPHEDALLREMYAHFGLAVYTAQLYEKGLANLISVYLLIENKGKWSREQYLKEVDQVENKAIGTLLNRIKKFVSFDDTVLRNLEFAQKKRNYLVHNYFWENAAQSCFEQGQREIIKENQELQNIFAEADALVGMITQTLFKVADIDPKYVEELANQMVADEIANRENQC